MWTGNVQIQAAPRTYQLNREVRKCITCKPAIWTGNVHTDTSCGSGISVESRAHLLVRKCTWTHSAGIKGTFASQEMHMGKFASQEMHMGTFLQS
jgi:hypothetical protein